MDCKEKPSHQVKQGKATQCDCHAKHNTNPNVAKESEAVQDQSFAKAMHSKLCKAMKATHSKAGQGKVMQCNGKSNQGDTSQGKAGQRKLCKVRSKAKQGSTM